MTLSGSHIYLAFDFTQSSKTNQIQSFIIQNKVHGNKKEAKEKKTDRHRD